MRTQTRRPLVARKPAARRELAYVVSSYKLLCTVRIQPPSKIWWPSHEISKEAAPQTTASKGLPLSRTSKQRPRLCSSFERVSTGPELWPWLSDLGADPRTRAGDAPERPSTHAGARIPQPSAAAACRVGLGGAGGSEGRVEQHQFSSEAPLHVVSNVRSISVTLRINSKGKTCYVKAYFPSSCDS